MYCMYCGKQVDSSIPICSECFQSNSTQHNIMDKVNLEAQHFRIEKNVQSQEDNQHIKSLTKYANRENSNDLSGTIIVLIVCIILICLIIGSMNYV